MTGPDPAVARVRSAVRAALADLPDDALVLVACSGGPDSLALAAATAFVASRTGRRAGAVVVDHGLLPGSDAVAERAADRCRELGLVPVDVVAVTPGRRGGPEAAARDARYTALREVAGRHDAAAVLLGHTLDDQAEQVLLGLARGSGARSLGGMPARRGLLRRPLLGVRRRDTERACEVLGLDPWHDPGNADPDGPLRSQVRTRVLPLLDDVLGPGVADALARTADRLREDDDALTALADELLHAATVAPDRAATAAPGRVSPVSRDGEVLTLDVERLAGAPAAVRRRALHRACRAAGVPGASLAGVHVLAVDALVVDWRGQGPVDLPGGRRAERRCGRLTLHPGRPDGDPSVPVRGTGSTTDETSTASELEQ